MLIIGQGWTFGCSTLLAFGRSRCVIRAYITYSMGVFRKKEGGEGERARGNKGELSWENGGAMRLGAILFRVAKTGFRSSCILVSSPLVP